MENNKGDLISREWLKDAFDNLCCHNCKICRNFRIEDSFYKCNLIENTPSVETDIAIVAKDAYKQGYTDGWKERYGEPNERLQVELANDVWRLYKKYQPHLATRVIEFGDELKELLRLEEG